MTWTHLDYFDRRLLNLNKELTSHPKLMERIANHPSNELEVIMAEVCAYCEVILDGTYTLGDLSILAEICTRKLEAKRLKEGTGIILIN